MNHYHFNMKKGDWITYNNKRKKCFGIHHNGNILIKMNGTLVQVSKEKCKDFPHKNVVTRRRVRIFTGYK